MARFYSLTVRDVRRETPESVSIAFDIPGATREKFTFQPGQFITLEAEIDGHRVRRPYSISSGIMDGELRVAVKRVEGGVFSSYANDTVRVGTRLRASPPEGRFGVRFRPGRARHYAAFAAGSGITPIFSIIKSVLECELQSRFTLIYGNRDRASIMFRMELEDLKDRYPDRFSMMCILSRENRETEVLNGRIDAEKCALILGPLVNVEAVDAFFLCGPEGMTKAVEESLVGAGVRAERIQIERFTPASDAAAKAAAARQRRAAQRLKKAGENPGAKVASEEGAEVTATLDGARVRVRLGVEESVLDGVLRVRPEAPYACRGGMCCTCRAKLLKGKVEMDQNYTLEPEEVARGFILTCQAHPLTDSIVIDYDTR